MTNDVLVIVDDASAIAGIKPARGDGVEVSPRIDAIAARHAMQLRTDSVRATEAPAPGVTVEPVCILEGKRLSTMASNRPPARSAAVRASFVLAFVAAGFSCRSGARNTQTHVGPDPLVSTSSTTPSPAPSESASAPPLNPPKPIDTKALCAPLVAKHDAVVRAFEARTPAAKGIIRAPFGGCWSDALGVWALVVIVAAEGGAEDLYPSLEERVAVNLRVALVRKEADGTEAQAYPTFAKPRERNSESIGYYSVRLAGIHSQLIATPFLYDWDGDGRNEIVIIHQDDIYEGGSWTRGRVWTFRPRVPKPVVIPYLPASEVDVARVEDGDGDGIPDLITASPYIGGWGIPWDSEALGPTMLVHAVKGGAFERDDAAATAFAKRACPAAPTSLTPKSISTAVALEPEQLRLVACARLWGIPQADVAKWIAVDITDERAQHLASEWAALRPPLMLK